MRVVLVNGEGEDETRLGVVLRRAGLECVSVRISAACLHSDHHSVWRMASGCLEAMRPPSTPQQASTGRPPRGILFELADPPVEAIRALAAIRADPRFDALPAVASLSIDHIEWLQRARSFDDFLLAPWSPIELIGRIDAAERRRSQARGAGMPEPLGVSIDAYAREININGAAVRLTTRECALFSYLWSQRGAVLSREQLLQHVWGESYRGGPRTVDVHIRRLRSKLGRALTIETVRGGGYRLLETDCFDSRTSFVAARGRADAHSHRVAEPTAKVALDAAVTA